MDPQTAIKRKRCRRGGRKKKALIENTNIPSLTDPKTLKDVGPCFLVISTLEASKTRYRKRCRRRTKKASELMEGPSPKTSCYPENLNIDNAVIRTPENSCESRLSDSTATHQLKLKPPNHRKRKRKRKHTSTPKAHNVEELVAVTAIQEILIGDIVTFKRMILKDCQPFLETVTAKVFLKMKYGDQSSTDHDTLLIRPLIVTETGSPHQEPRCMGEPEFLKFEDVVDVMKKLTS